MLTLFRGKVDFAIVLRCRTGRAVLLADNLESSRVKRFHGVAIFDSLARRVLEAWVLGFD